MAKPSKPKRSPKRRTKKQKRRRPKKKTRAPKAPRGPKSFRSTSKVFHRAEHRTQLQKARDDLRGNECLKKIRYAFRLMWQEVPKEMTRYRVGPVDSFDVNNVHRGTCWGWPKECALTNLQARTIFFNIYKRARLTIHQLIVVRKGLAYAYELTGGTPGKNFPGVKEVWSVVREQTMAQQKHHVLPCRIPTPQELRIAFNKEWTPASPISLVGHCQSLVYVNDLFIFGLRSTEDVKRVKNSVTHYEDWDNGWQCTEFQGGRAKLCGAKKGTRPWRIWRVCHCPGKHHVRPPKRFYTEIQSDGNPRCAVKWCTVCPLACLELIFTLQEPVLNDNQLRCYPKWLTRQGRFGKSNVKDIAAAAVDWFVHQGVVRPENRFNRNAGRKSLARWTRLLMIPYAESFQCHGDLWEVWHKNYETEVPMSGYSIREQSTDPVTATVALRKFANFLGRGKKLKPKLCTQERFQSDTITNSVTDLFPL